MPIKKAIITAAGRGARLFPAAETVQKAMLPIEDRDGLSKPAIQIIAEEALASGIEELCIVCAPGDEKVYLQRLRLLRGNLAHSFRSTDWAQTETRHIDQLLQCLHFCVQDEPRGYGHAVYCAKDFVKDESFLLLLGDHLYISHHPELRCARQLLDLAEAEACSVSAVNPTPEHLIGNYGTLTGRRFPHRAGVYQIERILEKPSLSLAEQALLTPGLRVGHYLCFFGMHVLAPSIFDYLEEGMEQSGANGEMLLTPAQQELADREKYLALEIKGQRYDMGVRLGLIRAQIALGLAGTQRDQVLSMILETLAQSPPAPCAP